MLTKDNILAALPELNQADLLAIKQTAEWLIKTPVVDANTAGALRASNPETWLAEALGAVIGQPMPRLGHNDKAFNKNAPTALSFINTHFAEAMGNRTTALALMRYLLKLLADNLVSMKVPVTRTTLSQNLHRLGEVFNSSFPGYAEGSAAKFVELILLKN